MEADEQVALKKAVTIRDTVFNWNFRGFDGLNDEEEERFDDEGTESPNSSVQPDAMTDEKAATYSRVLSSSEKFRISNMLESWEEPHEDQPIVSESAWGVHFLDALADSFRRMPSQFQGFYISSRALLSWTYPTHFPMHLDLRTRGNTASSLQRKYISAWRSQHPMIQLCFGLKRSARLQRILPLNTSIRVS